MVTPKRPERIAFAVLLAAVILTDAMFLDEFTPVIVLLAGLLSVILLAGSFEPIAGSQLFTVLTFVIQVAGAVVIYFQGHMILAVIVAVAGLGSGWQLWSSQTAVQ